VQYGHYRWFNGRSPKIYDILSESDTMYNKLEKSGINSDKVMGDKSILLYTTQNAKQGSVPFRHWVHGVQSAQVSNATLHLSCSGSFSVPLNDINNHHAKYSSDC
jgi:hypothetical protein